MTKKKTSKTRSYGTSKRESHDSSHFYNSKLYESIPKPDTESNLGNSNDVSDEILDTIIPKDSQKMIEIPDNSIHLVVTSPPYNVRKEYDEDLDLNTYLSLLRNVLNEIWRVLVPGGRVAINIANIGRKPYIPLHVFITNIMLNIGYIMRGEIIWYKSASSGISCAWGSFGSATNPCLRDVHEYILVFSKQVMKRQKYNKLDTINHPDFVNWTKSLWTFPAESARKIGHPAPFPIELPRRIIELYSFKGDIVLDPFIGSGTTAIAAIETKRHFIGYDNTPEYVEIANKRIQSCKKRIQDGDQF